MNLDQITPQGFILALFIRDDGERFLLGSGAYEFNEKQLHFTANSYANDIIEVQGNDGVFLAGQVRRATTQSFDGYIGDATVSRSIIETYRKNFLTFFRKNYYYKVVYVFNDGTAIQRQKGFIVDAPEVKELYQKFPGYHIGMNFEDVNYYTYLEDSGGNEIYGKNAVIPLSAGSTDGGLIWGGMVSTTITKSGTSFGFSGYTNIMTIDSVQIKGNTTQQTYSGAQLLAKNGMDTPTSDTTYWKTFSNATKTSLGNGWGHIKGTQPSLTNANMLIDRVVGTPLLEASTLYTVIVEVKDIIGIPTLRLCQPGNAGDTWTTFSFNDIIHEETIHTTDSSTLGWDGLAEGYYVVKLTTKSTLATYGIRMWSRMNTACEVSFRISIIKGDHSSDWKNYCGDNWQPYVGGVASPNPDYPQTINVVTGEQTITVSDGDNNSDTYTVDLGSVELCRISGYQDKIYNNGNDWYVHKETGFMNLKNTTGWWISGGGQGTNNVYQMAYYMGSGVVLTEKEGFSDKFDVVASWSSGRKPNELLFSGNNVYVRVIGSLATTAAQLETYLASNDVFVYYILATPIDTKITDATLIAQLEALAGADCYDRQTTFTLTASSLQGILSVEATYDGGSGAEWDNIGAVWEEGGGGGPTTIMVDSIDNVYPVWEVKGPAVNPEISVLTTGTTLSYSGTVTATQTLKIDMFNKTALLNGTSVIGNVSGDWIYLNQGNNRVTYTTDNATADSSTIYWQEIVG